MAKKKGKRNRRESGAKSLLKISLFFLIVLTVVFVLVNYVFRRTVVHNVSMKNTLFDGDNIIMDQISYRYSDPKRFDIICFKSYKERDLLIKRVIGLPGETVRITSDGDIYINDEIIADVKGLDKIKNPGLAEEGITLLEDEYFVVGDNRDESTDSRSDDVGNVRRKDILGKATLVIWPFNHIKVIK